MLPGGDARAIRSSLDSLPRLLHTETNRPRPVQLRVRFISSRVPLSHLHFAHYFPSSKHRGLQDKRAPGDKPRRVRLCDASVVVVALTAGDAGQVSVLEVWGSTDDTPRPAVARRRNNTGTGPRAASQQISVTRSKRGMCTPQSPLSSVLEAPMYQWYTYGSLHHTRAQYFPKTIVSGKRRRFHVSGRVSGERLGAEVASEDGLMNATADSIMSSQPHRLRR
ncbi:hypothetical protein BaRGS_00002211, partial [Batillaria attramentaria]